MQEVFVLFKCLDTQLFLVRSQIKQVSRGQMNKLPITSIFFPLIFWNVNLNCRTFGWKPDPREHQAHHALHLLISCLIYTSSTAESEEQVKYLSEEKGTRWLCVKSNQNRQSCISLAASHISADWCESVIVSQVVSRAYLSLRCCWRCRLWPAAGSVSTRSLCL